MRKLLCQFGPLGLALVLVGVVFLSAAQGQRRGRGPSRPSYQEIPIQGDFNSILQNLLKQAEGREEFEDLLKKALQNPDAFKMDPEKFKGLDPDNPLIKERLKNLLDQTTLKNLQLDPEKSNDLKQALEKLNKNSEVVPPVSNLPKPPEEGVNPPAVVPPQPPNPGQVVPPSIPPVTMPPEMPQVTPKDTMREWVTNWMKNLEGSELQKSLAGSKAFENALEEMQKAAISSSGSMDQLDIQKWGKFTFETLPEWTWNNSWWNKLEWDFGEMKMPNIPSPNISIPKLGPVGNPSVAIPATADALPILVGLLVVVLVVVVVWQMMQGSKIWKGFPGSGPKWQLGPWPVDPSRIHNRAELISAFEYLSLLLLGQQAKMWNHQTIANHLRDISLQSGDPAGQLAELYQKARYAPLEEVFPEGDLQRASKCVGTFAGVPSA